MLFRLFLASLLAWTASLPPPLRASEGDPIVLAPSGRWSVRYDENQCVLGREFGIGEHGVLLEFSRFEPGDKFILRSFGRLFEGEGTVEREIKVAFGDSPARQVQARPLKATIDAETMPGLGFGLMTFAGPWIFSDERTRAPITPEQESAIRTLSLASLAGMKFRIDLGSMGPPMAAMRACMDDLLSSWGYDPTAFASLKRRAEAVGNVGAWVTTADVPLELVKFGPLATVRFRLDIDEGGQIKKCSTLEIIGSQAFGPLTCELVLRRARFTPASDFNGSPIRDFYVQTVRWVGPPG